MIALISFKEEVVIIREEAEHLKLQYTECQRVGFNNNDKLAKMDNSSYYRDELVKNENEKYCKNDKEVPYYYIYERPQNYLDWVSIKQNNQLVDLEWFAVNCNYPFYIEKAIKSEEPTVENINSILYKIEEKTQQINKTIDIMTQQTFNQKVNVHLGGGLITTYNDLCLKEDCCTDELQKELNNGWRIIAVCNQPDQRRPDYVLGRYNPEIDVYECNGAKRG
jgi:hypothetical protein